MHTADSSTATNHSALAQHAAELYDALERLIRVYQFRDRDRICCHDISLTQCHALEAVVRDGPLTTNALSGHLYLDKSTVSRAVSALERKGLLRRRRHEEDRRAILLEATPSGAELYSEIRSEIEERERRLIEDFEPDVRVALIEFIRRLSRAAEERVDATGGNCCSLE